MALPLKQSSSAESLATIASVALAAFVICTLYFGRELLVPLALAALLTFLLSPFCTWLEHWIGRIGAVIAVVLLIMAGTIGAGWILTNQAMDLASELPGYKENIRAKLQTLKGVKSQPLERVSETIEDLKDELPGQESKAGTVDPFETGKRTNATQVEVVGKQDGGLAYVQNMIAPVLGPLGTAALVLLLLVFMLLQRDDLRHRLIRLIGQGRISATTRAMDDAGSRVARYLLMQLVVNVTYGIPVAIGLYFIGVPNAILWGAFATVLRFIPYVGPWIAASFPILLSLAISPGWTMPALTVGLFVVLELISNNVMEPWLYGSSTGVSPIALIVAALLWTSIWGPVGLVLATPITVCLVVMGRHIPRLAFLSIILSDEEALTPAEECYHRLHRQGSHEAIELVDSYLEEHTAAELVDEVLIPVIVAAETDFRQGLLDSERLKKVHGGLDELVEEMDLRAATLRPLTGSNGDGETARPICCVPAKGYRDELAGDMVAHLLAQAGREAKSASSKMVSGELVGWVKESAPRMVCVSVLPPTTVNHARYLCARLRTALPEVRIAVGLWGSDEKEISAATADLRESGANDVFGTVSAAMEKLAPPPAEELPQPEVA